MFFKQTKGQLQILSGHNQAQVYAILTFISVFTYCILWIWQGFDITDEGYNLTLQWLRAVGYNLDYGQDSTRWLSTLAAGLWLKITGSLGLIGARFGWAITVSITALLAYNILKNIIDAPKAYLGVISVAIISNYHGTMVINYNAFPSLLLVASIWSLLNAHFNCKSTRRQLVWSAFSGFFISLSIMSRLPLILILPLPFVPYFIQLVVEKKSNKNTLKLSFVSFLFSIGTVLLCISYLYYIGQLDSLIDSFKAISGGSKSAYSSQSLIKVTLNSLLNSVYIGTIFIFISLFFFFLLDKLFTNTNILNFIFLFGILFLIIFPSLLRFNLYQYVIPGTTLYFIIFSLIFYFIKRSESYCYLKEITYLTLAITYSISIFLGSGNGILNIKHGLWLIFPLFLFVTQNNLLNLLNKESSKTSLKNYASLTLFALVFAGAIIRFYNPYRDSFNRFQLTAPLHHPNLQYVYTTVDRAASVNELLEQINKITTPGESILAYNNIPMIHYLTRTIPFLDNPWPDILSPEDIIEKTNRAKTTDNYPRVVIRTITNTRNRFWGTVPYNQLSSPQMTPQLLLLNQFIVEKGYLLKWSNRDFQLLLLPNS